MPRLVTPYGATTYRWDRVAAKCGVRASSGLQFARGTDSCDEAGVYVGTAGGEIFYSRNGGDKWELPHAQLPAVFSLQAYLV